MKKGRTKSIVLLCLSKNAYKDIDEKKKSKKRLLLLTYIFSEKKSLNNLIFSPVTFKCACALLA